MTPRERFVHFVATFASPDSRADLIEEALRLDPAILDTSHTDEDGDLLPAALTRPMESAWEFVQHRSLGGSRPHWYPAIVTPEARLIR